MRTQKMTDIIYENENYKVQLGSNVLGEDNEYSVNRKGYHVINKVYDVIEHTTMLLPQAIFQSDALNRGLDELNKNEEDAKAISGSSVDSPDVTIQ